MTAWRLPLRETIPRRMRRTFRDLRLEGRGASREAAAVGLGVFLGCLPLYGLHLLLCWLLGSLFRLNRLKVYLAANISNPFVAPWLLLVELQTGAWLRHGARLWNAPCRSQAPVCSSTNRSQGATNGFEILAAR